RSIRWIETGDVLEQVVLAGAVGVTSGAGLTIGCGAITAKVLGAPQIRDAITDTVGRDPDLGGRAGCAETGGADRVGAGCAVVAVSVGGLPVGDGVVRCVLPKVWSGGDIEGYGNARLRNAIGGDHGDDSVRGTNNVRGRGRRQDATD